MQYKAIFFDWDGTAVKSRKEPVDSVVELMKKLLSKDVKMIIISGTTYDKIADGKLHEYFTKQELGNLYLGWDVALIIIHLKKESHCCIRNFSRHKKKN